MLNLVVDGNSLSVDVYFTGFPWPTMLAQRDFFQSLPGATMQNFAVGGQTTQDMIADAATQIDSQIIPGEINILIAWEIGNDFQSHTATTAQGAIDNFAGYCLARKAAGWDKVIIINLTPRDLVGQGNTQEVNDAWEAKKDEVNALLFDQWQDFSDGLVDLLPIPELQDEFDDRYFPDGVHPGRQGNVYIAEAVEPVLKRVYNSFIPNIFEGRPNVGIAKQTMSFVAAGITIDNMNIIYEIGASIKSYVPGRPINAVSSFTADQGYYMIPKTDIGLSEILVPPI